MHQVVWVIGPPAVGKTTLVMSLLKSAGTLSRTSPPLPKWTLAGDYAAAGHYSGEMFDGPDKTPYNGTERLLSYWAEHICHSHSVTFLDGDRLSDKRTMKFMRRDNVSQYCIKVTVPDDVLVSRRLARNHEQNAAWVKGRATKADNFYGLFDNKVLVDGTTNLEDLTKSVNTWLDAHRIVNSIAV